MDPSLRWDDGKKAKERTPMRERFPCVYMLANRERRTLYTGVTSDLVQRVLQHKEDQVEGFTRKYKTHALVWYEAHEEFHLLSRRQSGSIKFSAPSSQRKLGSILMLSWPLSFFPSKRNQDQDGSSLRWDDGKKAKERTPMRERFPCVYILANRERGTLYTGVTSDLVQRVWQHKEDQVEGFTRKYKTHALVWYEAHEDMFTAITREKALKAWKRIWKIELIESSNPAWRDLYSDIV